MALLVSVVVLLPVLMVSATAVDVLVALLVSPPYTAVRLWHR